MAMALSPSHNATASAAATRSASALAAPSCPRLVVVISRVSLAAPAASSARGSA
jgi:hypothetical protein